MLVDEYQEHFEILCEDLSDEVINTCCRGAAAFMLWMRWMRLLQIAITGMGLLAPLAPRWYRYLVRALEMWWDSRFTHATADWYETVLERLRSARRWRGLENPV